MLVVATALPGTFDEKDCQMFEEYAARGGVDLKFYHLGPEIFRIAKERRIDITPDNVLDADHEKLDLLRTIVLERIYRKISRRANGKNHITVIRTHAKFLWNDVPRRAWYSKDILALNPDMFVTFVDGAEKVLERLNRRSQWAKMDFSLKEMLYWLNEEVSTTDDWADLAEKPFYVVPKTAPPQFFCRLLCNPDAEVVYVSMPLTHAYDKATQRKVDNLVSFLNRYFIVIDPRWIDPLAASKGKGFDRAVYNNVINRDLEWFVRQSRRVIGYLPKIVLSAGLVIEIYKAFISTKDTSLVWPRGKKISPFSERYARQVFYSLEDLKKYVKENFKELR